MPPRLDYNFKDLDFETQQQLLDLCDQVKKIFIRNILKTVANNCVINNGESPDFLNFLRNCLTIFFNILDIGSASPQSYPFLFT